MFQRGRFSAVFLKGQELREFYRLITFLSRLLYVFLYIPFLSQRRDLGPKLESLLSPYRYSPFPSNRSIRLFVVGESSTLLLRPYPIYLFRESFNFQYLEVPRSVLSPRFWYGTYNYLLYFLLEGIDFPINFFY